MSRPPTTLCSSSTLAEELALGPAVAGFIVIPFHLFVFFTSSSSESLGGRCQFMNKEETGITILLLNPDNPEKKNYMQCTCQRKNKSFSWMLVG